MTLEQIWISATKLAPWRRNYSQSPRRQITQIVPFLGTNTVLFTFSYWGLTEKAIHATNLLFMNCEIVEEVAPPQITQPQQGNQQQNNPEVSLNNQNNSTVNQPTVLPPVRTYGGESNAEPNYSSATHFKVTYNNKNYWVRKIDLRKQPVLVRCSCSDYYFTWSYANYIRGVQFGGRARPYVRKTPKIGGVKPRNPMNISGLCKHVSQAGQMMQTSGYAV